MRVIDKEGNVLLEREMPRVSKVKMSSVRINRRAHIAHKKIQPVVISTADFLAQIPQSGNGSL